MTDRIAIRLAAELVAVLSKKGATLSLAESCTGGLIGAAVTSVPGASAVFTHGFVTYANEAKRDVLGVSEAVLQSKGAVSAETAWAMANGARDAAKASLALSVTGVAGPGGGSPQKPVGTVWFGIAGPDATRAERRLFAGMDRETVRTMAVRTGLRLSLAEARKLPSAR
jgi:nicotinamide-nucleotide amidase